MPLTDKDIADLARAKDLLENPGLAMKITNVLAKPIEQGLELLPQGWQDRVQTVTQSALDKALTCALLTMDGKDAGGSWDFLHKMAVAVSGGVGGAFGLPALAIELPISTTIILRSIADIARSEGEPIQHPISKLACLEVFALGGRSTADDAIENGYFAVRMVLAQAVSQAAKYIAERGIIEEGAPVLVRLISQIATRFSVTVSEKVAAEAIPIIGGAGGAIINTLFINHFQAMAHGHFIVRRLERSYDPALVKEHYERI